MKGKDGEDDDTGVDYYTNFNNVQSEDSEDDINNLNDSDLASAMDASKKLMEFRKPEEQKDIQDCRSLLGTALGLGGGLALFN